MSDISSTVKAETRLVRISPSDHVAVALVPVSAGTEISIGGIGLKTTDDIPAFHKVALEEIDEGQAVFRFGQPIGIATSQITPGQHVHSHNVKSQLGEKLSYDLDAFEAFSSAFGASTKTFMGYRRADGRVGTRNDIWIIPTVGCVAKTAEVVARKAMARLKGRADNVIALPHPHGCSQLGDDLDTTRKALAALAGNPNVGGIVFIALGCETNKVDTLLEDVSHLPADRIRVVRSQLARDEMEVAEIAVDELLELTATDTRSECGVKDLVIGLKCGGSDALSGLTANPLLGDITDMVTASGGKAILTEIPEIFGAEQLLMKRSPDRQIREGIAELVNDFKDYYIRSGHPVNENPSPGNKAGGITTLEEKSLGAVQKSGLAPVSDVIRYGEAVSKPGLTLLEAPGNDAVSCTALTAAGANIILFTTGRGTPLGFPVPTLKISSNTALSDHKPGWIDFDAGQILASDGRGPIAEAFLDKILAVASGAESRNERNGEQAIAIWKKGVTL